VISSRFEGRTVGGIVFKLELNLEAIDDQLMGLVIAGRIT
jgi:hypothetical protein